MEGLLYIIGIALELLINLADGCWCYGKMIGLEMMLDEGTVFV